MPGEPLKIIRVRYDFKNPVELTRFTASLDGLGELYRANIAEAENAPKDIRLFIREVREGSIEVDLVEMIKTAGGVLAPIATHIHYAEVVVKKARQILLWLNGTYDKPEDVTKKEIEAASAFLAPIAENSGSNVQINVKDSPNTTILIGSVEANAMQNGATRAIMAMKEPQKQTMLEAPLIWHQTDREGATAGKTGLKAVVEDVSSTPMPVYFAEAHRAELKSNMIENVEFPYRKTFIVDVETLVVMGKLKGYKILKLHAVLE